MCLLVPGHGLHEAIRAQALGKGAVKAEPGHHLVVQRHARRIDPLEALGQLRREDEADGDGLAVAQLADPAGGSGGPLLEPQRLEGVAEGVAVVQDHPPAVGALYVPGQAGLSLVVGQFGLGPCLGRSFPKREQTDWSAEAGIADK